MSRIRLVLILGLAVLTCACSTSNQGIGNLPGWSGEREFSVVTEQGTGSFSPTLTVSEDAAGALVTVNAVDASALAAAYLHLNYDSGRYTPESVEFGDFLGNSGQVLTLALTDRADDVPIGICQIPASGVQPVDGAGLLARVRFRAEAFRCQRSASCSPISGGNAVDDLLIIGQTATTATLRWTEHNIGDYDNNSIVGIADLTPIGIFFNQTVASASNPVWAGMVDGDGNGMITIGDMTPIGANFGAEMTGYILYTDNNSSSPYGSGITVLRDPFFVDNKTPVVYQFTANVEPGIPAFFSVKPVAESNVSTPGPASNIAQVVIDPGAPTEPTNLAADASETIGSGSILLTWTASTSPDVAAYEVERKLTSEDDTAWTKLTDVPAASQTYTDSGLTDDDFDYRVRARDFTDQLSNYSNVALGHPWYEPPPSPPENVEAVTDPNNGAAVYVSWDQPSDDSALGYKVYRKGPQDASFSMVAAKNNKFDQELSDQGLNPGDTYEYYVTSVAGMLESVPSPTVNAVASQESNITITALTTDKTTHCNSASEPASNLAVTADLTPDSVDWAATRGTITPNGNTATWKPTNGQQVGKVTVTCTVHKGSNTDSKTIDLYVTSATILTEYGDSGHFINGAPKLLSGGTTCPTLEPLSMGGNRVENREMQYYMTADHVTYFSTFDIS
jgi:hypothetical protein